ncbi:MAG: gluconate 2-dehydrogenase subunit 3 family protein [Bryobacteraceae bacterium]
MANQAPARREILEILGIAAAVSQFPGFSRWACAAASAAQPKTAVYRPQFFTPAEYLSIDQLTELIIPGAKDAGVSEFIDFMAANDPEIQTPFRAGLQHLGQGDPQAFLQASVPENSQTHSFFKLIRTYTVMGYYTTRIGLEELDYPGLRFYTESPACPHTNDPEHRHLPPPPEQNRARKQAADLLPPEQNRAPKQAADH